MMISNLLDENFQGMNEINRFLSKKGKIFFIFVTGGAKASSYKYQSYFDKDENLIRHL